MSGCPNASRRPAVTAPPGAPNVVIILLDDAGYGQTSTFGGLVPTPTLEPPGDERPSVHALSCHGALLAVGARRC